MRRMPGGRAFRHASLGRASPEPELPTQGGEGVCIHPPPAASLPAESARKAPALCRFFPEVRRFA